MQLCPLLDWKAKSEFGIVRLPCRQRKEVFHQAIPPLLPFPAKSQRPGAYISEHPSPHVQVLVLAMCSVLWSKHLECRPIAAKVVVGLASQGILVPDVERKEEKRHSLEKMATRGHALDPAHS